ncbi:MAG: methyltransferase type 11 [Deltaproteobacteria bacterium HGW-Deltaproteobacteria-2]|jgi:ubiquinone/menaquinone biosynthesis C-methylase UbiE|nr:MAG: methyltransferase type 11 [Deltaproteobacteria bacterium HGW-Deltaproteobacteria-2]
MIKKLLNKKHVCPWWLCFTFDNPLRRIFHDPIKILSPYVHQGDTAIDIGPGMGYFSIPLAKLVGPSGRIIAVDIQQRMLSALDARAQKHGVSAIIKTHLTTPDSLCFHEKADFILAFWMAHEVPDQKRFFSEIHDLTKPEGLFLLIEPVIHVSNKNFSRAVEMAKEVGFSIKDFPKISMSQSVLFHC